MSTIRSSSKRLKRILNQNPAATTAATAPTAHGRAYVAGSPVPPAPPPGPGGFSGVRGAVSTSATAAGSNGPATSHSTAAGHVPGLAAANAAASITTNPSGGQAGPAAPVDLQSPSLTPARGLGRPLQVHNETGRLRSVIIGLPDTFELPPPINKKHQIYHADHPERPTRSRLMPEFAAFREALEACGVEVIQPRPVPGVPDQLTPRDIGFVLGDTFVVSNMKTDCRRHEWKGIEHILEQLPTEKVVWVPDDVTVEGGDIILDRGTLYIGLSERTSIEGAEWLREHYAWRYRVQLVPLKELNHGEDVLHMDCTFLPVGEHHCLIYPDGFHQMPKCIRANYEWIEITKEEQFELGTNVLSVSPTQIISRHSATRINNRLRELDFEVIEVKFDETPKGGGSFRCASLPLVREDGDGEEAA